MFSDNLSGILQANTNKMWVADDYKFITVDGARNHLKSFDVQGISKSDSTFAMWAYVGNQAYNNATYFTEAVTVQDNAGNQIRYNHSNGALCPK